MPKTVCTKCQCEYRVAFAGIVVIEMASFGPYKVWSADLKKCRGCGNEIVAGFGDGPIRQDHYADDFPTWLESLKARCAAHDVPVIYDYERPQGGE